MPTDLLKYRTGVQTGTTADTAQGFFQRCSAQSSAPIVYHHQVPLLRILGAERIGVSLSEEFIGDLVGVSLEPRAVHAPSHEAIESPNGAKATYLVARLDALPAAAVDAARLNHTGRFRKRSTNLPAVRAAT